MRFLIMDAKLTKINQNFNKLIEYFIVCTIFCYKITFKSLNSIIMEFTNCVHLIIYSH
jgi:hypothetical protein